MPQLLREYFVTFSGQKSRDKFLTVCYVLLMKAVFHFSFIRALYARGTGRLIRPFFSEQYGGLHDGRLSRRTARVPGL